MKAQILNVQNVFKAIAIAKKLPAGLDKNRHLCRLTTRLRKALIELAKTAKSLSLYANTFGYESVVPVHASLMVLFLDDILGGRVRLVSVTF